MKVTAFLLLLLISVGVLAQQQQTQTGDLPPGPTTAASSTLEDQTLTEQFDLVQLVLDFAPETWTPMHTHGGRGIVTVIEGEITVRMEDGTETTYQLGDMWVEEPGAHAEVGNAGEARARVVVSFLLPEGAELTTVQE
jgi:quercetin dioxygenase-like cupin family protein